MRISDWSSDVCSSDLLRLARRQGRERAEVPPGLPRRADHPPGAELPFQRQHPQRRKRGDRAQPGADGQAAVDRQRRGRAGRSEEHTSELQSLMRISYAVFCLKKKNKTENTTKNIDRNNQQSQK